VDVPAIDCVLFADPKQSVIDIVQAAGRALRPYAGKEYGYIMLPLIVPDGMELAEFTDSTPFKEVARIIAALSTQDERIAEEFRISTTGKQKGSGGRIEFTGTVPVGMKLDLTDFAATINAKIWEKVAKVNWRAFEEARACVHNFKLKSANEWRDYCKSGEIPGDIPIAPNEYYKYTGWTTWGDWLGTGSIATSQKEFRPFIEAREYAQSLGFKNLKDWQAYLKSGRNPDSIPANPDRTYLNEGWKGWGDWLGTGTISNAKKQYRPFIEAREYVHTLKLKSGSEWKEFCRLGKKPSDIPNKPEVYHNQGWKGMGDWLGSGNIAPSDRKFRSFQDAREFAHKLQLKNYVEWSKYAKSGRRPDDIPSNPWDVYSSQGWKGTGDWLGTGTIATNERDYKSFQDAREFVHKLCLKSGAEWKKYTESGKKPDDIPFNPRGAYAEKGWTSMGDWLGTGTIAYSLKVYTPFEEARAFVHKLGLKNGDEWLEYCLSGKKPDTIPSRPNQTYKDKGWFNLGDWLGTGFVPPRLIKHRPFKEARAFVQNLGLMNSDEWREYCKSGNKPDDIPSNPAKKYANDGWNGMGDWLGTGSIAARLREYRPFEEAKAFVHTLNLKNSDEWDKYCKTYAKKGWKGIGDWLDKP
jgi:hypothetical protein